MRIALVLVSLAAVAVSAWRLLRRHWDGPALALRISLAWLGLIVFVAVFAGVLPFGEAETPRRR